MSATIIVWTDTLRTAGPNPLNITVGSAGKDAGALLAPTWGLARGYKHGRLSTEQYTARYQELIGGRDLDPVLQWVREHGEVTLVCYCKARVEFCHRYLAAQIVKERLQRQGLFVDLRGEWTDRVERKPKAEPEQMRMTGAGWEPIP